MAGASLKLHVCVHISEKFHKKLKKTGEDSKYSLAYLGIDNMSKEELLLYLNEGVYNH